MQDPPPRRRPTRNPRHLRAPRLAWLAAIVATAWFGAGAGAADVDWAAHAERDTVEVITTDEDGERRETTIWLVVLDGDAFVRTGSTSWGSNVERDPRVALRLEEGGPEIPLLAEFVTDEPLRERVTAAFREKYGFADRLTGLVRFGTPKLMRLLPRSPDAEGATP